MSEERVEKEKGRGESIPLSKPEKNEEKKNENTFFFLERGGKLTSSFLHSRKGGRRGQRAALAHASHLLSLSL